MPLTKEKLNNTIDDLFTDFLYYDRKEDDEFTLQDVKDIPNVMSHEEMLEKFLTEVNKIYEGVER